MSIWLGDAGGGDTRAAILLAILVGTIAILAKFV